MKEDIVKYLSECNLVELNHIVRSAIEKRKDTLVDERDEGYGFQSKLLLCEASRERYDSESWEPWKFSVIATEDKAHYEKTWETGNGEPFLQQGECKDCGVQLSGHAKKSICPLCGKYVPLT